MIRQPLYTDSATEAYNAMLELSDTFSFSEDIGSKVKTSYYKILELVSELSKIANQVPEVSERDRKLEALFIGPRGENIDVLQSMIIKALGTHRQSRREYLKNDPIHITNSMKKTDSYRDSQDHMQSQFSSLLAMLKKYSVPFYSPRYQGHMIWEQTIPSIAGYVSAMLYNPNNIAFEASPITTVLELLCAQDLCNLFDFPKFERMMDPKNKAQPEENINSWGHLTCDGTIANMEGLWASRNAKYYPFAIKRAMLKEPNLKAIGDQLLVKTAEIFAKRGQPKRFVDCSLWELMNIPLDEIVCLTHRIFKLLPDYVCIEEVYKLILKYSVQKKGILDTYRKMEKIFPPKDNVSYKIAKIFVSASKHYSLPKAVNLLGLGEEHLVNVAVTEDTRLDMEDLSKKLYSCGEKQIPVITVIVVMGSTEESSVDPLSKVLKLRDALRKSHGLDFNIHADCAFGGYFKSTLVEGTINNENDDYAPLTADLNKYTQKQFKLLHQVDTLTVDPHKSGYVPYACGAFLYRNGLLRNMLLFTGPYIGTQGPNVGIFGIEGSKAGAQAAAVYLSHQCLPLNRLGHGMLLRLTLFNTKIYYIKLMAFESRFHGSGYRFKATPLPRLPSKRKEKSLTEDFDLEKIAAMDNDQITAKLCADMDFREWFNELGPDQNILSYAFNFYDIGQGQWNKSLERMNRFNHELYKKMSPHINRKTEMPSDLYNKEMLVSETEIFQSVYGNKFFKNFIDRTSTFDDTKSQSVKVLRSVLMNPWSSETKGGSFIDNILKTLDGICCEVMSNRIKWDSVKPPKFREAPLI